MNTWLLFQNNSRYLHFLTIKNGFLTRIGTFYTRTSIELWKICQGTPVHQLTPGV